MADGNSGESNWAAAMDLHWTWNRIQRDFLIEALIRRGYLMSNVPVYEDDLWEAVQAAVLAAPHKES